MADVARLAGVSHQTVSRVLNEHPNVRHETRLRVRAAMAELGYRPNRLARALVTGRSRVIGVVAQGTTLYGPASLLSSFDAAATERGFTVDVATVRRLDRAAIAGAVDRHLDQRVAGLVVIAPVVSAGDALEGLPRDVPLVVIDGDPRRRTPLVRVDQELGGFLATRHLLEAGHRTVWHVAGPSDWFDATARTEGWRRALAEAGAPLPDPLPADWTAASGYERGRELAGNPEVTAVFAANDHLALGILRALTENGRRVPHDCSLVGFDDVPEAAYFSPPLTTVRADLGAVADEGLALLLEQIEAGGGEGSPRRTITPTLVERGSVAPPPS
jgi:DNA-binding LacI/PurR family transcriptional regulator